MKRLKKIEVSANPRETMANKNHSKNGASLKSHANRKKLLAMLVFAVFILGASVQASDSDSTIRNILILIAILFLIREFWCWFFKTNKILKKLEQFEIQKDILLSLWEKICADDTIDTKSDDDSLQDEKIIE
jgi:hypothetical protein